MEEQGSVSEPSENWIGIENKREDGFGQLDAATNLYCIEISCI